MKFYNEDQKKKDFSQIFLQKKKDFFSDFSIFVPKSWCSLKKKKSSPKYVIFYAFGTNYFFDYCHCPKTPDFAKSFLITAQKILVFQNIFLSLLEKLNFAQILKFRGAIALLFLEEQLCMVVISSWLHQDFFIVPSLPKGATTNSLR